MNAKKANNKRRGYMIAIAAAAVVIIVLLIIIFSMPKTGPSEPDPTERVVILSPIATEDPTPTAASTLPPETGTPEPTPTPTEVPTPTPTDIPTEPPTSTPEPTPTQAPPTEEPSHKPYVIDGTTSANPAYAGKKLVALTFDDGPQVGATEFMLEVLKKHNAKATFFCVGSQLLYAPAAELTKQAANEGHQIGNHSYKHPSFGKISDERIIEERDKNNDLIKKITGQTCTVFRIPGGYHGKHVRDLIDMPIASWNIDPLDWKFLNSDYLTKYAKENGISYDEAESRWIDIILFEGVYTDLDGEDIFSPPVAYEMKHGSILLFHDIYPASAKAIDRLLTFLEENDGNFVYLTFDEFILTENDTIKPATIYYSLWRTTP